MTIVYYLVVLARKAFSTSKPVFKLTCPNGNMVYAEVANQYVPNECIDSESPIIRTLASRFSESFSRTNKRFEVNAESMARGVMDELEESILMVLYDMLDVKKPRETPLYHFTRDVLLDRSNGETENTKIVVELYSYMLANWAFMAEGMVNVHKQNVVAILTKVRDIHESRQKVNGR